MRKDWSHLEKYRIHHAMIDKPPEGELGGAFNIPHSGKELRIIATDGIDKLLPEVWEHVSVHAYDPVFRIQQIPSWAQMSFVKQLFWTEDEMVVQYHPAKKDYIDCHACVLHLWRPASITIPMPPKVCV